MESTLLEYLNAGGDLALIALGIIMWRFDRRVFKLELAFKYFLNGNSKKAHDILPGDDV